MANTMHAENRRSREDARKTFCCVFLDGGDQRTIDLLAPDVYAAAHRAMSQISARCSRIDFEDDDGRLHVGRASRWEPATGRLRVFSNAGPAFST